MISVQEAWEFYSKSIRPLPVTKVPVREALGRVLAEDVLSKIDLPPFNQSAMDGYALNSKDVRGSTKKSPVKLKIVSEVAAGPQKKLPKIAAGEAARIFTGALIPDGADAVLPQEDAILDKNHLVISAPLLAGQHLRYRGEEAKQGALLARTGTRITYGIATVLSIAGVASFKVFREPKIAVLTTGDEIVNPGKALKPGQVYDADSILTNTWLRNLGYTQVETSPVLDSLEATVDAMKSAFKSSDIVITCGGVSVGDKDFILSAAKELGIKQIFWRVKQRPGKPLYFGMKGKKILLGIPGNPGSVFVCLNVHAIRVLDLLEGVTNPRPLLQMGKLSAPITPSPDREFFVRCSTRISVDGEVWLDPLPKQSSHMITNLTECKALARISMGEAVEERGASVNWVVC